MQYQNGNNSGPHHGKYYAARIISSPSPGSLVVAWADGCSISDTVSSKRVLAQLSEAEATVIFDATRLPGRAGSYDEVTLFLQQGIIKVRTDEILQRHPDGSRSLNNMASIRGTKGWDGSDALGWILDSSGSFDPCDTAGHHKGAFLAMSTARRRTDHQNPGLPTFGNCCTALLMLKRQQLPGSVLDQKLFVLFDMLPVLLLGNWGPKNMTVDNRVQRRAELFLDGKWKDLFDGAVKALAPRPKPRPQRPPHADHEEVRAQDRRAHAAITQARAGALSNAYTRLMSEGMS